mgnify:CR=1 FL=1|tara:strand:- start:1597 stop:2010 length:414 start_codon:yes stop_codon:yes gene_type:complete
MATNLYHSPGLGNVGSYQMSARPYLTSSLTVPVNADTPLEISFETVSRFVIITNNTPAASTNVPLRFGFSSNGVQGTVNNNYGILNNGESFEAEFKVTSIYLLSDTVNQVTASVIAGLTGIRNQRLVDNWSGSAGVG